MRGALRGRKPARRHLASAARPNSPFSAPSRANSALPPTLTAGAEIEAHLLTFRARFAFALCC